MVPHDPLFEAIQVGDLQATRELLQGDEDIDINARYNGSCQALLQYACMHGELEIVKYLIQAKNANVNSVDYYLWTPLYQICTGNNGKTEEEGAKLAEFLLTNGADVNIRTTLLNRTALHVACWRGSATFIQLLLSHGANINSADKDGYTPLYYYACSPNPQIEVLKFLLANNADRHIKNHADR